MKWFRFSAFLAAAVMAPAIAAAAQTADSAAELDQAIPTDQAAFTCETSAGTCTMYDSRRHPHGEACSCGGYRGRLR